MNEEDSERDRARRRRRRRRRRKVYIKQRNTQYVSSVGNSDFQET